jgi:hypothetical protein
MQLIFGHAYTSEIRNFKRRNDSEDDDFRQNL